MRVKRSWSPAAGRRMSRFVCLLLTTVMAVFGWLASPAFAVVAPPRTIQSSDEYNGVGCRWRFANSERGEGQVNEEESVCLRLGELRDIYRVLEAVVVSLHRALGDGASESDPATQYLGSGGGWRQVSAAR